MSKNAKKVSDSELARFFLEKVEKDAIIPELFNLFGFDCLVRCTIDPNKLDGLIPVSYTHLFYVTLYYSFSYLYRSKL